MAQEFTQLIFLDSSGEIEVPYTSLDKYQCYPEEIGSQVEMISGRMVMESRGHVQMIKYSYDCMPDNLWRRIAALLRSGRAFTVSYLPDDGNQMITSQFICTDLTPPKFAFVLDGVPYWHNIEFTLREVSPHD